MGDRANIAFHEDTDAPPIYFYTHCAGSELPGVLAAALYRNQRQWGDDAYLARCIFTEMVKDNLASDSGFGISVSLGDGADRILHVWAAEQTVTVNDGPPIPFAEFAKDPSARAWRS